MLYIKKCPQLVILVGLKEKWFIESNKSPQTNPHLLKGKHWGCCFSPVDWCCFASCFLLGKESYTQGHVEGAQKKCTNISPSWDSCPGTSCWKSLHWYSTFQRFPSVFSDWWFFVLQGDTLEVQPPWFYSSVQEFHPSLEYGLIIIQKEGYHLWKWWQPCSLED